MITSGVGDRQWSLQFCYFELPLLCLSSLRRSFNYRLMPGQLGFGLLVRRKGRRFGARAWKLPIQMTLCCAPLKSWLPACLQLRSKANIADIALGHRSERQNMPSRGVFTA